MIDWTKVSELAEELGEDDFADVVGLFLSDSDTAVADLIETDDSGTALRDRLHYLKGSAMTLGFVDMTCLCAEGEKLAHAGSGDQVDRDAIGRAYAAARARLVADLPSRLGLRVPEGTVDPGAARA